MARPLILFQILDQSPRAGGDQPGRRQQLAVINSEEVVLGREPPPGGITVASAAVSRVHGLLRGVGQHWIYRDEGSTNGSWINGEKVAPEVWVLVKPGDYLQLGDIPLEIEDAERRGSAEFDQLRFGIRSLLVFSRGAFELEFPVPEFGRALVVGGKNADLQLDIDMHDLPSLVVERRGENVAAFTISKEVTVRLNGQDLTQTRILQDRDELVVDHYRILFSDVVGAQRGPPMGQGALSQVEGLRGVGGRDLIGQGAAGDPRSAPPGQSGGEHQQGTGLSGARLAHASASMSDAPTTALSRPDWEQTDDSMRSEGGWVDPSRFGSGDGRSEQDPRPSEAGADQGGFTGSAVGERRDPTRSFPWAEGEEEFVPDHPAVPRQPDRLPFGKVGHIDDMGVDQTVAIDPSLMKISRGGFDPSGRSRYGNPDGEDEVLSSLEDKIWLTVGLLMVLALILMVVWWLLSR